MFIVVNVFFFFFFLFSFYFQLLMVQSSEKCNPKRARYGELCLITSINWPVKIQYSEPTLLGCLDGDCMLT